MDTGGGEGMKQGTTERIADVCCTLMITEIIVEKIFEEHCQELKNMLQYCEELLYDAVRNEGDSDTFKVRFTEAFKRYNENVEKMRDPNLMTKMMLFKQKRRMKRFLLKREGEE